MNLYPKENNTDNIVIVSSTAGEGHGAEEVLVQLLQAWYIMEGTRPQIHIVAPPGSRILTVASNLRYNCISLKSRRDSLFHHIPAAVIAAGECPAGAIVHGWGIRAMEPTLVITKRIRAVSAICTFHDSPSACFHGYFRQMLTRLSSLFFDHIVCVSYALKREAELTGIKCSMPIIYNGIRDFMQENIRQNNCRKDHFVHIGFLGMNAVMKGFDSINEWILKSPACVKWHLYGDIHPDLAENAGNLQHDKPESIFCHGHCKQVEIFNTIDILVHASTDHEAFGLVLIEAACAGIPAVASKSGGPEEIIEHEKTGYLYDVKDAEKGYIALMKLIEDPLLRDKIGQAARKKWKKCFSSSRMAEAYRDFWNDIKNSSELLENE